MRVAPIRAARRLATVLLPAATPPATAISTGSAGREGGVGSCMRQLASPGGGFRGAARELRAALRIPRFATRAYVGRARSVPDSKARRALTVAAVVTGTVVLASAAGLGFALVSAMVDV